MNKNILIFPFIFLLLMGGVQAGVSVINSFSNGNGDIVKTITINEDESAKFWVSMWSDRGSGLVDISLRDHNNVLVGSAFEDDTGFTNVNNQPVFKEYVLNNLVPGEYKVLVYVRDNEGDILKQDLRLEVLKKTQPASANNVPVLVVKRNGEVVGNEITVDAGDIDFDLSGSNDVDVNDVLAYQVTVSPENIDMSPQIFLNVDINQPLVLNVIEGAISYNVKIILRDGNGGEVTKTIKVNVNQTPVEPPVQPPIKEQSVWDGIVRGDLNYDGVVTFSDFVIFSVAYESGDLIADLNGDGVVEFADFLLFTKSFGKDTGLTLRFLDSNIKEITGAEMDENGGYVLIIESKKEGGSIDYSFKSEADLTRTGVFLEVNTNFDTVIHPETEKSMDIEVSATDGINTIKKVFTIKVKDINRGPSITKVERLEPRIFYAVENQVIKYEVEANDADGDNLTYSVNQGNFVQEGNVLTWQTSYDDAGNYDFVITANDGFGGSDSAESISFRVADRDPIEFTSSPVTEFTLNRIGDEYVYDVGSNREEVNVRERIGNFPRYSVMGPEGMEIGKYRGEITWQPRADQDGSYNIVVTVRDLYGIEGSQEFTLEVTKPENQAPFVIVKDVNTEETVTSDEVNEKENLVLLLEGSDVDADIYPGNIVFSLEDEPAGMSINGNEISYTPGYDVVQHPDTEKRISFNIVVSDGISNRKVNFEVKVKDINRLPALILPIEELRISEGVEVSGYIYQEWEGESVEFEVTNETDPEGDNVTITLEKVINPDGSESEELKGSRLEGGRFIWDIRKEQGTYNERWVDPEDSRRGLNEPYQLVFKLDDGFGSKEGIVRVYVKDNNLPYYEEGFFWEETPPRAILSILGSVQRVDSGFLIRVNTGNSRDQENFKQQLDYRYDWEDDGVFDTEWKTNLFRRNSRTDHVYPEETNETTIRVQVRDRDGMIGEDIKTFDFRTLEVREDEEPPVTPTNNAPVVSDIPDQTVGTGTSFATINLDGFVTDETPDNAISWGASGNTNLVVTITGGVATIGYNAGWTGSEIVTFTATDAEGLTGSDGVTFTVTTVPPQPPAGNQAPVVSDIPDQTVGTGTSFATINLDGFVTDETPDNAISWSVSGNNNLVVSIDASRVATVEYNGFIGTEIVTFTATDAEGLTGSDGVTFTINQNNDPVLSVTRNGAPIGSGFTLNEGEGVTLNLAGSDVDGDNLMFEVENGPSNAVLTNEVWSWTPDNTQGGRDYSMTFRVLDLDSNNQVKGGSDSQDLVITVNDILEPSYRPAKKKIHHLDIRSVIVNDWQTVQAGESFDIDVIVKNKGNVKQKDVKVTIDMPQLDYFQRSGDFSIKKRKQEITSFAAEIPRDFNEDMVYAIVTVSNNKDKNTDVIGFLIE